MVSREHIVRGGGSSSSLHEKYQLLRSITKSHAVNKKSIIIDATKYIQELKQKVERFNEEIIESPQAVSSQHDNPLPMVRVETAEKGFFIRVFSGKSCPGLLVSVLAAFEELSLNVHEATVSCSDSFCLQAVGEENDDEENVDAESVEEAVMQAIKNWRESNYQQD